jgi:hypothetical protein
MGMLAFSLCGPEAMATVIDHLIELKRDTGRGKDAVDIEALERIKAGGAP